VRLSSQDTSGRVKTIAIETERKKINLSGPRFRAVVNAYVGREFLPSTLFSMQAEGADWIVSGHGWGHGVGMCQRGAMTMAKEGRSYKQILSHYYPGTHLKQEPLPSYASAAEPALALISGGLPGVPPSAGTTPPASLGSLPRPRS
jgi:peptidoglycan hydrolase-like amidase